MAMNDPISDMLTRLRNALNAGHATVKVPASRLKMDICTVLKQEGFIKDFTLEESGAHSVLQVTLKYTGERSPIIRGLRRVSRPSLRAYVGSDEIKPVQSGLGVSILSTSQGVMTGKRARQLKVGGELLCEVW